jgi:hypothetical protein
MMRFGYNSGTKENGPAVLVTPRTVAVSARNTNMRTKSIPALTPAQEERFWSKFDKTSSPDGCWLWTGKLTPMGYALVHLHPHPTYLVHRVAYTLAVGPIPDNMTIDHVKARGCKNCHCGNPDHLEPVPLDVNIARSSAAHIINAQKTHCKRGHLFSTENTRITAKGARACRVCDRIRSETKRRNNGQRPDSQYREDARNAARGKTHCKYGHELTEQNAYWRKSRVGPECRECGRIAGLARYRAKAGTHGS